MGAVKKQKFLYGLSWGLLLLLVFVTLFGSYLMPHPIGPGHRLELVTIYDHGVKKTVTPPLPPSTTYWLGTDHRGFDMISLILNGAKYTLGLAFAVTVFRFVIALPIGLFVGVTGRGRKLIARLQAMTSSVPPLLFIFPAAYGISIAGDLNLGVAMNDPKEILFMKMLFIMMVLIGIFSIAHQFAERAAYQSGRLFILASRTMGATSRQIVIRHLLPLLRDELWFAFITELVQVLFLIGQLAVVNVFVGGGEKVQLADATPFTPEVYFLLTGNGEWGGLIAYGSHYFQRYPWIILSVGAVFACSIMILVFFSRQLQAHMLHGSVKKARETRLQKRLRLSFAVAIAICITFIAIRPIFFERAVAVSQPTDSTSTPQKSTAKIPPEYEKLLVQFSNDFMSYLAQNQWEYAFVLTPQSASVFPGQPTPPPPHPYDVWINDLTKQHYKITKVGPVQQTGDKRYSVKVLVNTDKGTPVTWYLDIHDLATGSGSGTNSMRVEGGQDGTS